MSDDKNWYAAVGGVQKGPFTLSELKQMLAAGDLGGDPHVYGPGMSGWEPARKRPEVASALPASPPPPPPSGGGVHDIDFEVVGEEMQFVEIILDPREACIAEAGSFMYMDPGIEMETIFGDGSAQSETGGLLGKIVGAGKRILTGESLFMTLFANTGASRQKVAFAAPYPGRIIPVDLRQLNGPLLCQKQAFLCAAKGISVGIALQRKLGSGLFGGEGFILEKLEGDGLAFLHAGGTVVSRELAAGEVMRLDTGCLVAFDSSVDYDIQGVPGIKTALFGGEGLFFARMTGPGTVWIQSLPFSRLASRIYAAAPQTGGRRTGEGSVLGGLGGLVLGDR
jgi:uncharacterized protein (TIGR00266 family)